MAVYSIFKAIGLQVSVRPVIKDGRDWIVNGYYVESYCTVPEGSYYVGTKLHEVLTTSAGGEGYLCEEVLEEFKGEWLPVTWLIGVNKATRNLGMAHIAVCVIAATFHDLLLTLHSTVTRLRWTRSILMPRSPSMSQRLIILFVAHLLKTFHVSPSEIKKKIQNKEVD